MFVFHPSTNKQHSIILLQVEGYLKRLRGMHTFVKYEIEYNAETDC